MDDPRSQRPISADRRQRLERPSNPLGEVVQRSTGRFITALVLLALPGCTAGPGSPTPAAAGAGIVDSFKRLPDRPGYELYLANQTPSPVTITSLTLYDCANITERCGTRELAVVLGPGETRPMVVVEPRNQMKRWEYRWRWTAAAGVIPEARPSARAPAPDAVELEGSEDVVLLLDPRGRFVNAVLPAPLMRSLRTGAWNPQTVQPITRALLRSFGEGFDFLMIAFSDDETAEHSGGMAFQVGSPAAGLGLPARSSARAFGSRGRLASVLLLAGHGMLDSPVALHEVAHMWGQHVLTDTRLHGHWGFAGVGGLLGGWEPGTLEERGRDLWAARGPGRTSGFDLSDAGRALQPYAPLELYLMGLLPADSVPPFQAAVGAEWVDEPAGVFRAESIRTVTMEEVVASNGPRVPSHPEAASEFRGIYVVLSSAPLSAAARSRVDDDVADFARPGPRQLRWYLNFWEATGGRGRLVMDRLDEAVVVSP